MHHAALPAKAGPVLASVDANDGETAHAVTVKDVPVDAFWSVTVYNADGCLEPNDPGVDSYDNVGTKPNDDGSHIFGVRPTVAGITDNATYSNVTQENRAFGARCLAPWAKRIEQAMNRAHPTPEERRVMFIEHDLSGLLRGDLEARFEAYRIGREGGCLSANDIRGMENLSPIEGGDAYLRPLNMTDASKEGGDDGET